MNDSHYWRVFSNIEQFDSAKNVHKRYFASSSLNNEKKKKTNNNFCRSYIIKYACGVDYEKNKRSVNHDANNKRSNIRREKKKDMHKEKTCRKLRKTTWVYDQSERNYT